jgi:hypothetical protein
MMVIGLVEVSIVPNCEDVEEGVRESSYERAGETKRLGAANLDRQLNHVTTGSYKQLAVLSL